MYLIARTADDLGQIKTAEFFINTELPLTSGKMEAIQVGCATAIEITDEGFGGL